MIQATSTRHHHHHLLWIWWVLSRTGE